MIALLYVISALSVIGTLVPILDIEHWIVRGQAYFRGVYLGLNAILLILILIYGSSGLINYIFIGLLILAIFICLSSVLPFTKLGSIQVKSAVQSNAENSLNILIYNVYQENKEYQKLINLVDEIEPDIIFLLETNIDWDKGLDALQDRYQYHLKEIKENTYGLMLFSKLEFLEGGINFLVRQEIPSVEILLQINQAKIRLIGIHPKPPVLGESKTSRAKDRELIQVARYLNNQIEDDHQILIGDLNDVAWSRATRAYKKMTGMQDPRAGRGFYPTFPTWFPIKIPLDHVFCSEKLELINFRTLKNIGSDHYPVNVVFKIP